MDVTQVSRMRFRPGSMSLCSSPVRSWPRVLIWVCGPPRPIFVIGADRSGVSALTWALGQHHAFRASVSHGAYTTIGGDFTSVAVGYNYAWAR